MGSNNVWLSVSGFFYLKYNVDPFRVHPCCSMNQCFIPFYGWIILHWLYMPQIKNTFTSWWPVTVMHIATMNMFCVWTSFSVLLGLYLGVGLMGHVLTQCCTQELPDYWPKWLHHFVNDQQCVRVPVSPHPWWHRFIVLFSVLGLLLGVKYLIVAFFIFFFFWPCFIACGTLVPWPGIELASLTVETES